VDGGPDDGPARDTAGAGTVRRAELSSNKVLNAYHDQIPFALPDMATDPAWELLIDTAQIGDHERTVAMVMHWSVHLPHFAGARRTHHPQFQRFHRRRRWRNRRGHG
jgi:hypothetical protein